jgi:hypothetical protein
MSDDLNPLVIIDYGQPALTNNPTGGLGGFADLASVRWLVELGRRGRTFLRLLKHFQRAD